VSRCVRRSWLCGQERRGAKNYDYRKDWLKQRLFHLAKYFAIEVDAYTIMSNHFHLVVFYDPKACEDWSCEEVAYRWFEAFPPRCDGRNGELDEVKSLRRERMLTQPERIQKARRSLGSLSDFMKYLKQPIAWRANREDGCKGHFFEGRFYSGALLCESAVLAAMAYVDLNPVRAKIARSLEACVDSSISARLKVIANSKERLLEALKPLVSGLERSELEFSSRLGMTHSGYVDILESLIKPETNDTQQIWRSRVAMIRKRQRAFGFVDELQQWVDRHGLKRLGMAMAS